MPEVTPGLRRAVRTAERPPVHRQAKSHPNVVPFIAPTTLRARGEARVEISDSPRLASAYNGLRPARRVLGGGVGAMPVPELQSHFRVRVEEQ
jgi:hypothetical protein